MGFSNECRDCVVCPLTVDDKIAGFPDTGPRRSFVPILLVYLNIKFLILGIKPILDTRTMMMHHDRDEAERWRRRRAVPCVKRRMIESVGIERHL